MKQYCFVVNCWISVHLDTDTGRVISGALFSFLRSDVKRRATTEIAKKLNV